MLTRGFAFTVLSQLTTFLTLWHSRLLFLGLGLFLGGGRGDAARAWTLAVAIVAEDWHSPKAGLWIWLAPEHLDPCSVQVCRMSQC